MSVTLAQVESKLKGINRDWNQKCQALAWNLCSWFGHAPMPYLSANKAYRASKIVSKDSSKAPAGAWHYWSIGSYGHVAFALGGNIALMASSKVDKFIGEKKHNVGTVDVDVYSRRTGAIYLGWSNTNGANDFELTTPKPAAKPAPKPAALKGDQRKLDSNGAAVFDSPLEGAKKIDTLKGGMVVTALAWTEGRYPSGSPSNAWYQIGAKAWIHGADLLDHGKHDLKKIVVEKPKPHTDAENDSVKQRAAITAQIDVLKAKIVELETKRDGIK